jgi:Protein of unknown function (DUF2752)
MRPSPRGRVASVLRAAMPPAPILFASAILFRFPPEQCAFYPQCPFHQLLNLECPGCGATRALAALLHGDLAAAIHFNALVIAVFPLAAAYGIFAYAKYLKREPIRPPTLPSATVYAALGITLVFGVIRNLRLF